MTTTKDGTTTAPAAAGLAASTATPVRHATRPVAGSPTLEHAHWCRPQPDQAEIRTETFSIRNADTGHLFSTTRCLECGCQFTANRTAGGITAEVGDNTLVPRWATQLEADLGEA